MDDEDEPTHSEAFERFRRGEIDATTYLRETEEGLVDVLYDRLTAPREPGDDGHDGNGGGPP